MNGKMSLFELPGGCIIFVTKYRIRSFVKCYKKGGGGRKRMVCDVLRNLVIVSLAFIVYCF